MLRLVLMAGGAHLTLRQSLMVGVWGAALADAQGLHLKLVGVNNQLVQQLAAAAPGGTLPGVIHLTLEVRPLTRSVQ